MAQPLDRLRHQIEMLAGMKRQGHARLRRQIAAPHAAAIDDHVGGNLATLAARLPCGAGHFGPVVKDLRHLDALDDLRASHPRALGQRHRDIGRVALPVQRQMHRPHNVGNVQMRIQRLHLGRRNLLHVHVEGPRQGRLPVKLFLPRLGQRDGDGTDLPHPGGNARLLLQPDVKIGGILGQPRHVLACPQLPDQPRRMPGRAAGQPPALQQHDVAPAELGQMIGDRTAGDPAPDDDDTRVARNLHLLPFIVA